MSTSKAERVHAREAPREIARADHRALADSTLKTGGSMGYCPWFAEFCNGINIQGEEKVSSERDRERERRGEPPK